MASASSASTSRLLFKGTYAWHVTSNLLYSILGLDGKVPSSSSSSTSFEVSEVDFFICHSWSCPASLKALAVCHQLNLNLAIATSIFACLFSIFTIVLCGGPHVSTYSRWLTLLLIGVFMTTYLFGHFFNKKTVWFDRISVDQGNLLLKSQTISQIPTFIARSSTLMVLWDDTLFARLWCNFELAVRAKVAPNNIQIVPWWMAVWTLIWFSVQAAVCFAAGIPPLPHPNEMESRLSFVVSLVETWTLPVYMYFLMALIASFVSLEKLKGHKSMLDRMASFDIRNAKCTLETDRIVIEEQVFRLFDEALEPAVSVDLDDLGTADPGPGPREASLLPLISPDILHDIRHITSYPTKNEVMDQFNVYVRGPLRNMALASTGPPGHVSFKFCCVFALPYQSFLLCHILTCEGHSNCEAYVSEIGYSSVAQYMAMNTVMALFLSNFGLVIVVPLVLLGNEAIGEVIDGPSLKRLMGAFLGTIIMATLDYFAQVQSGMFIVICTKYSPLWLAVFLVGLIMQIAALWAVFFRTPTTSSLRCLAPERLC